MRIQTIKGPYQNGELVSKIDISEPVIYRALPDSQDVSDDQLLLTKWDYQYNTDAIKTFKHAKQIIVHIDGEKMSEMTCKFHNRNDIHEIRVFAYQHARSSKVVAFSSTNFKQKHEIDPPTDGSWHDPIINPISTNYLQSGGGGSMGKHWGLFGTTRNGRNHAGIDLFAKSGTPIYACVDGTVYRRRWHNGYGNTITIKVKDKAAFLKRRRSYHLPYKTNGEITSGNYWNENGDIYLLYAHLNSAIDLKVGDHVKCGQVLGETGRSGIKAGTCAPHLHFEVLCRYAFGGTKYRMNPGYFVHYKGFDEQSEIEHSEQTKERERGKIKQYHGQQQLPTFSVEQLSMDDVTRFFRDDDTP